MPNTILILNTRDKDPNIIVYEPIRNTRRFKYFQKINDTGAKDIKYNNSAKQIEQIVSLDEDVLHNLTTAIRGYKKKRQCTYRKQKKNKKTRKSKK